MSVDKCLFNNETAAILFYDYLNTWHNNVRFTMEKEMDKKLPFLDVLIDSSEPKSPHTSIYRKKTFSGLLTNYFSFVILFIDRFNSNANRQSIQD